MEHLNRLIRMVNAVAEYERKAAEEKAMAEAATEGIFAKQHAALHDKYESCAQAIATYCILPEKTFAGYRQYSRLYFIGEEYNGEIDCDYVWDTLQEYGVLSMDELVSDFSPETKDTFMSLLKSLISPTNPDILNTKIENIVNSFENGRQQDTKQDNKPRPDFRGIIQYEDKEKLIMRLHSMIDGKGGKDVGLVLNRALTDHYLTRLPHQDEFTSEFELIGSWQGIHKYANGDYVYDIADIIIF